MEITHNNFFMENAGDRDKWIVSDTADFNTTVMKVTSKTTKHTVTSLETGKDTKRQRQHLTIKLSQSGATVTQTRNGGIVTALRWLADNLEGLHRQAVADLQEQATAAGFSEAEIMNAMEPQRMFRFDKSDLGKTKRLVAMIGGVISSAIRGDNVQIIPPNSL